MQTLPAPPVTPPAERDPETRQPWQRPLLEELDIRLDTALGQGTIDDGETPDLPTS